jgi:hypothetical protein
MNRARIIIFLTLVALVAAFTLPAVARADGSTDGWTWDESVVTQADPAPSQGDPAPDGWTWDDAAITPSPDPAPDGWTWDE